MFRYRFLYRAYIPIRSRAPEASHSPGCLYSRSQKVGIQPSCNPKAKRRRTPPKYHPTSTVVFFGVNYYTIWSYSLLQPLLESAISWQESRASVSLSAEDGRLDLPVLNLFMYLDLQNGQNNGPSTAYSLYFGILGHCFWLFWRSR